MEQGNADPLPDWVGWLRTAERLNCRPWDLLDDPDLIPRWLWMRWSGLLAHADGLAQEWHAEAAKAKR